MERLGEVPVAVIEKAKTCGGHNLSGAVMRPGPLQELFPELSREEWRKEGFAFGEVKKEAVYVLPNSKTKLRIPPPPPFSATTATRSISVSALARYQQRQAEEAGAYILTETAATQLIVEDGRVVGVRSGDKGRGKDGEPLGNFEPGTDIKAQATVLAEGCWGHLTGAAIKEFDLAEGREPQVWELGVKEVWKVTKPLDRVIHTLAGWPLKICRQVRADRRLVDLPDEGREDRRGPRLASASSSTSTTPTPPPPPTTCCSRSRRTRWSRGSSRAASASPGAPRRCPAGGYWAMPKLSMPGAVLVGDAGGHREPRGAEGRPLRDQVGHARGRGDLRGAQARRVARSRPTSRRSRTRSSAKTCANSATRASPSRRA